MICLFFSILSPDFAFSTHGSSFLPLICLLVFSCSIEFTYHMHESSFLPHYMPLIASFGIEFAFFMHGSSFLLNICLLLSLISFEFLFLCMGEKSIQRAYKGKKLPLMHIKGKLPRKQGKQSDMRITERSPMHMKGKFDIDRAYKSRNKLSCI